MPDTDVEVLEPRDDVWLQWHEQSPEQLLRDRKVEEQGAE